MLGSLGSIAYEQVGRQQQPTLACQTAFLNDMVAGSLKRPRMDILRTVPRRLCLFPEVWSCDVFVYLPFTPPLVALEV